MKAVILGSTLSAIREALRLRAAGWSVLLCAQSTYLAEDVTATWHGYGVRHQAWLGDRLAAAGLCVEPPFLPGRIKKEALRVLLDADVEVRFMTRAAGLLREEGRVCGVVLARKGGLDRERCDLLLDATLYHVASARLAQRAVLVPAGREVSFSLEYRGITLAQDVRPLSDHEALERGPVAQDHAYLTVTHTFAQDTPLEGARAALWRCALHAAKRLAQDERFLHLEMTNALPDQIFVESPETEQAVEITDGLSFDASWAAYPVCPAQVLVCGAGTAGIRAALAAAPAGDVLLTEFFPYPGGTRTMGGIQWLYYGNRSPLFQKMFAEIERYAGALTHGRTYSHFGSAEAFLYLEKLQESGVAYRPDTLVCGARLSGGRISEVLCVSAGEIFVVHPDKVLDATGDGDVAALCGVPMETGDSMTGMVQNYSQAHRISGTRYDCPMADQDTLRTDLPEEWQRAVIQNTLGGAEYDCMEMLTPRESSRILGQYRITLEDAARGHVEPDALIDAYSSYDPHCRCLSLPGRLGLMPERAKPRYVSIPYRALRTHEAGNLLVLGKAISATQDAFNYCRMCADVMALGHAAGRIAALSDDLSAPALTEVQQEMFAGGALVRRPSSEPYDENTAERVIAPLLCGVEGALAEVVLCAWPQTQKLLLGAMESGVLPDSKRVAHALLYTGDTRFAPDVLEDFVQRDEALAGQYGEMRGADGLIHGGYRNAPDDVWLVNQAMVLLAHVQYRPAIPALCAAMERTGLGAFYHPQTATYGSLRPDCMTNGTYDRMLCMAEVGLLMPDGALAGPLMRLSHLAQDIEPQDRNVYMAYLALRLAHAALLCGSGDAQTVIETYGRHPHGVLRTYAQRILESRSGRKTGMKVICNPLNLPYRYQMRGASQPACREAADPTLIEVNGQYALFPSMTAGFHTSEDLCTWTFHVLPEDFPANDYAPDGCVLDGEVQLCASHGSKNGSFYRSRDPLAAPFREIPGTFPFWDPHQFVDDDGRLYFYWGCSNAQPIRGVEMDRNTMRPLGEPVPLIAGHPEQLGYERMGEDGSDENSAPWIEGAWMTKHNGRYYLQYAAPGTEFNTYADGVYESEHPLGPFVPAKNLPYSFVPDGFAQGAGHGSTLRTRDGQLFHAATMRISVNHPFERRLGLWRAGFDADGLMYCDQRYADWPMALEDAPFSPPRWMLLSHGKPVRASSGENAACAVDENIRTWWSASENQPGEWLEVDLQAACQVNAVQINFADEGLFLEPPCPTEKLEQGRYIERVPQHTRWLLEGSTDGKTYFVIEDKRRVETDLPHDLVVREAGVVCRFLRLTVQELPYGQKARISGLRVFGHAEGEPPRLISSRATREGARDMLVTWDAEGADGVCIQWGSAPDKLYHSCLTYASGMRRITALCEGQRVWFRVDAFNGSGITCGEVQEVGE